MSYEHNPGKFSLFKNKKKEAETHPDYKGDGVDLDGRPIWVSAWLKEGKNGKFLSCSFKLKEESREIDKPKEQRPPKPDFDDDIPF